MTKIKNGNVEVISVSLETITLQAINKAVKILDFDNRSTMIERAVKEFLIREVVKRGKKTV